MAMATTATTLTEAAATHAILATHVIAVDTDTATAGTIKK